LGLEIEFQKRSVYEIDQIDGHLIMCFSSASSITCGIRYLRLIR
jgi:hypothetical protein